MSNSSQSNVYYSNEIFKQYLMQISSGLVWKNTTKANLEESTNVVDVYLAELFVVANRGLLNFDIVKSFPRSILLNSGVPYDAIEQYASDKRKIPVNLRSNIVSTYQNALASRDPYSGRPAFLNSITGKYEVIYEESNNYYRMLMGLPDLNDTEYIYNTDSRWDTETPIHELSYIDRIEMESEGILSELLIKNPSKKYIEFLGKKYIDPFKARIANRFELLYYNNSPSDTLTAEFVNMYNKSRQLVMSIYYNTSYSKSYDLYENFLAMCILFMTLQAMQYKYLQVDITRDFYDTESLKLVYDAYGVPFYSKIPLEYHRKIVKNINKLISYKGSPKVFFDLFDIFDFRSMDIYSYFLTKTHIVDTFGKPTFIIKKDAQGHDMYDEDGNPILDESNYKIAFSKVKIYDDPALSIANPANAITYEELTYPDPYWISDADLIQKLSNEKFNFMESKYIGVQTVYDLMKIVYENAYAFRMITDNRELTERLTFRWADLGIDCTIFEVFIYLASLYCRYFGYQGIISTHIPAIMDTLGYDFEKAQELLRTHPIILGDPELFDLVQSISATSIDNLNFSYSKIMKIQDKLIDGYINAKSVDEFNGYRELYNSLMISREITSVYSNKQTGEVYETFVDMLSNISPELMQRYLLLPDDYVNNEIVIVTDQIEDLLPNLKYISLSSGLESTSTFEALYKILTFFKSAKAELASYNITYTITTRGLNFFKMIDLLCYSQTWWNGNDVEKFDDLVKLAFEMVKHLNEVQDYQDTVKSETVHAYIKDYIESLVDMIVQFTEILDDIFRSDSEYIDFVKQMQSNTNIGSILKLSDISNAPLTKLELLDSNHKDLIKNYSALVDGLYEYSNGKLVPVV